jgi:hypothetical protein
MIELPDKTRRAARRLRFATIAAIVLLEAAILAGILVLLSDARTSLPVLVVDETGLPPWPSAGLLFLFGLLIGLALFRLVRLLARVERGAAFGAAGDLRGFALWLLVALLVSIIGPPVVQAGLAAGGGGASHRIQFSLDNGEALMLLVAGLLFLVARLLDQAQALAEDHEQIV